MILSIDVGKAFDKVQDSFMIKSPRDTKFEDNIL